MYVSVPIAQTFVLPSVVYVIAWTACAPFVTVKAKKSSSPAGLIDPWIVVDDPTVVAPTFCALDYD